MEILFILLMAPVVTLIYVVLKDNNNSIQEYKDMKNKVNEKSEKIKRLFTK